MLDYTVLPANASNKAVTWTSSKPEFVTVLNGTITGVSAGVSVITVTSTDGSKTDTITVTVTEV